MRRSAAQYLLCTPRLLSLSPKPHPKSRLSLHSSSRPPHLRPQNRRDRLNLQLQARPYILRSSYTSYTVALVLLCGSAALIGYFVPNPSSSEPTPPSASSLSPPLASNDPFFTDMPIPPGHRGNLTADQEAKLRELWALTLKTFCVSDPTQANGTATPQTDDTPTISEADSSLRKKRKSRLSIFGSKKDDEPGSPPVKRTNDSDDKYGQVKHYNNILSTQNPEALRVAFWTMVKADHPDQLLLRFLRARKWDVDKALVMMISTVSWRSTEMRVDDEVIFHGEGGALRDSKSTNASVKREGSDFLEQLRLGKSFLHGTDKEGRPLCFVRARLHHGGDQTEKSLERYTVYLIETARLVVRPPAETATLLFDLTQFTMANMDYTPVKFMIKVFEANYPESLGAVLVHKAPWIFQGIWKIIKGWLDPVVAAKIHFTDNVKDLEEWIPRSQIIKELDGDEDWEYTYVEPLDGEDDLMKDEATTKKLMAQRNDEVLEYQRQTFELINNGGAAETKEKRDEIAKRLHAHYWQLDPYIRARTLYDRVGMIEKDGNVIFYPNHEKAKAELANGLANTTTTTDDVD